MPQHTLRAKFADLDERARIIDLAIDADRNARRPLAFPGRTDLTVDSHGVSVARGGE